MDYGWMHERLDEFRRLCERYQIVHRAANSSAEQSAIATAMAMEIPTIRAILQKLDGDLVVSVREPEYIGGALSSLRAVQHGLGILRDREELAARLAPDAPSLVADAFHPAIWHSAADLWGTGRYLVVVGQAANALSALIQVKAGSSLTGRRLVTQVLSPEDPNAGSPIRLHLPGDRASETWRNRQSGLHQIAQGIFAGMRNVAAHSVNELTEQAALEHLATISLVARWSDETIVTSLTGPTAASN